MRDGSALRALPLLKALDAAMRDGSALRALPLLKALDLAMRDSSALRALPLLKALDLAMRDGSALRALPLLKALDHAMRDGSALRALPLPKALALAMRDDSALLALPLLKALDLARLANIAPKDPALSNSARVDVTVPKDRAPKIFNVPLLALIRLSVGLRAQMDAKRYLALQERTRPRSELGVSRSARTWSASLARTAHPARCARISFSAQPARSKSHGTRVKRQ